MTGVNLIPSNVLGARRRSRRIRQWTVVTVIAAAVAAVPVLVELRQHALSAKLVERQQIGTARLAEVQAELDEVNVSVRQLRDGIERADGLCVVITTNRLEKVDRALGRPDERNIMSTRPGRIDRVLELRP